MSENNNKQKEISIDLNSKINKESDNNEIYKEINNEAKTIVSSHEIHKSNEDLKLSDSNIMNNLNKSTNLILTNPINILNRNNRNTDEEEARIMQIINNTNLGTLSSLNTNTNEIDGEIKPTNSIINYNTHEINDINDINDYNLLEHASLSNSSVQNTLSNKNNKNNKSGNKDNYPSNKLHTNPIHIEHLSKISHEHSAEMSNNNKNSITINTSNHNSINTNIINNNTNPELIQDLRKNKKPVVYFNNQNNSISKNHNSNSFNPKSNTSVNSVLQKTNLTNNSSIYNHNILNQSLIIGQVKRPLLPKLSSFTSKINNLSNSQTINSNFYAKNKQDLTGKTIIETNNKKLETNFLAYIPIQQSIIRNDNFDFYFKHQQNKAFDNKSKIDNKEKTIFNRINNKDTGNDKDIKEFIPESQSQLDLIFKSSLLTKEYNNLRERLNTVDKNFNKEFQLEIEKLRYNSEVYHKIIFEQFNNNSIHDSSNNNNNNSNNNSSSGHCNNNSSPSFQQYKNTSNKLIQINSLTKKTNNNVQNIQIINKPDNNYSYNSNNNNNNNATKYSNSNNNTPSFLIKLEELYLNTISTLVNKINKLSIDNHNKEKSISDLTKAKLQNTNKISNLEKFISANEIDYKASVNNTFLANVSNEKHLAQIQQRKDFLVKLNLEKEISELNVVNKQNKNLEKENYKLNNNLKELEFKQQNQMLKLREEINRVTFKWEVSKGDILTLKLKIDELNSKNEYMDKEIKTLTKKVIEEIKNKKLIELIVKEKESEIEMLEEKNELMYGRYVYFKNACESVVSEEEMNKINSSLDDVKIRNYLKNHNRDKNINISERKNVINIVNEEDLNNNNKKVKDSNNNTTIPSKDSSNESKNREKNRTNRKSGVQKDISDYVLDQDRVINETLNEKSYENDDIGTSRDYKEKERNITGVVFTQSS